MKKIIIAIILFSPKLLLASNITESYLDTSNLRQKNFLEVFGLSRELVLKIQHLFSFSGMLNSLHFINIFLSILFVILILLMLFILLKILSYSKTEGKLSAQIKILPYALKKNYFQFFEKYCIRQEDGTYSCSYSKHKRYSKISRISFVGVFGAILLKFVIVILLFLVDGGYLNAFAGRSGANYTIFIDSQLSGGGLLTTANYSMETGFGEPIAGEDVTSGLSGYQASSGITSINDEPSIGLSYFAPVELNFGVISNSSTSYGYHTITAYYNGNTGYDLVLQGNPPTDQNNNVITPIGSMAVVSNIGSEQFGINLTGNTSPLIIGSDPVGGHGTVTANYSQTNKFSYNIGDVIASSMSRSSLTTYTVTLIMNISSTTPAGSYSTNLVYTIVPKF